MHEYSYQLEMRHFRRKVTKKICLIVGVTRDDECPGGFNIVNPRPCSSARGCPYRSLCLFSPSRGYAICCPLTYFLI